MGLHKIFYFVLRALEQAYFKTKGMKVVFKKNLNIMLDYSIY